MYNILVVVVVPIVFEEEIQRKGGQSPLGQFLAQGVRHSVVVHIVFCF